MTVSVQSEKGNSGFIVWRYRLARDDPEPAPWEEGGKEEKYLTNADVRIDRDRCDP